MIPSRLPLGGGQDITLEGSTGDISLDGGKLYPDKDDTDTYIQSTAADTLTITVGNAAMATFTESTTDEIQLSNACDLTIDDGKLFFAADDADTYVSQSAADKLEITVGGVTMAAFTESTADDLTVTGSLYKTDGIIGIPLNAWATHDAMVVNMPAAAANDDFALVDDIAALMELRGKAVSTGSSETQIGGCMLALPSWYKAGQTVTFNVRAKVTETMNTAQTIDLSAYVLGDDDAISVDLVTTAVQNLTTSYASYNFVINDAAAGEALGPGDVLQLKLTTVSNDTGGSATGYSSIIETKVTVSA